MIIYFEVVQNSKSCVGCRQEVYSIAGRVVALQNSHLCTKYVCCILQFSAIGALFDFCDLGMVDFETSSFFGWHFFGVVEKQVWRGFLQLIYEMFPGIYMRVQLFDQQP